MAYDSFYDVWEFFKKYFVPDFILKRRLNFLTLHYFYMIGMTILFSIIFFGIGDVPYIDAIFFAAGGCTQSGLNTIDVNKLHTGQQVCLYLIPMLCNPISIHSFVVFVRLYWFERRFKDIVREARAIRRTKPRSRTNTASKDDAENARQDMSVRGRAIHILHNTGHVVTHHQTDPIDAKPVDSASSSDKGKDRQSGGNDEKPPLDRTGSSDELRMPLQLSPEQHIRFLENQRNPSDIALRIPSPREFDQGGRPETVQEPKEGALPRRVTSSLSQPVAGIPHTDTGGRLGPHITIDEPQIHRDREKTNTFPRGQSRSRTNPNPADLEAPRPLAQSKKRTTTFGSFRRSNTAKSLEPTPYLSYQPTIGRNSFFVDLTEEQREELGGIEYRSLKTLALILVLYFFGFHFLGFISLTPWIIRAHYYGDIIQEQGIRRVWWGFFSGGSAFNDVGFTLTNNSMVSFQDAVWPLLIMTYLIFIGNTAFPCMLRFIIWVTSKFVPIGSGLWEELKFLLDHPRRCFTLLFPSAATWWLFGILVILNGVDVIFFIILDLNDDAVSSIPGSMRFLDGLFQAASTRTAGFSVVNLAELHPAIQVSYLIMMYISVFPIAISMRRTNVYEEKSLGLYANPTEEQEETNEPSYVGAHLRKQLSFDLWYVFLGLFIITIVEGGRLQNTNEYAFTIFSVLFEIISAYGTVGLSLGYPSINASFAAEFKPLSKLVIIAMMIRGRHRGLPYALDRAILLPSESLHAKEAREGKRMIQRRRSSLGTGSQLATEGQIETAKFRPETGLATGYEHEDKMNRSDSNMGIGEELARRHTSHARQGVGQAMYKLASGGGHETVKEESEQHT